MRCLESFGPHFSAGVFLACFFLLSEALWTSWTMCTKSLASRRESTADDGSKAGKDICIYIYNIIYIPFLWIPMMG